MTRATIDRALAAGAFAFVAKGRIDEALPGAIRDAAQRTKGGALSNATDQKERITGEEQG